MVDETKNEVVKTPLIQIARSWYAFLKGDSYTKLMMQKRLAICDSCEYKAQISIAGQIIMTLISNDPDATYQCTKCGCPLMGKTAETLNECPIGKWKANTKQSYF